MIAQTQMNRDTFAPQLTPAIAADALTRIPSIHFRDMNWAKDSIARCAGLLVDARKGDHALVCKWVSGTGPVSDAEPRFSVLTAVGDALVADAFRSHGDVSAVSGFIAAVERDVLRLLADHRCAEDLDALNDPDINELVAGLVRIVQLYDRDTAAHLEATAALARRIATHMRLPSDVVTTVDLAARLHDIGKVGVRKAVLCKPGPLDPQEWAEMRRHAEFGAAALQDTPKLAFLVPIVRAVHERVDGNGYPDRLIGSQIPLESRVIAAADAFHSMTSERCYRRAILPNAALRIIDAGAGLQFDIDVVEAVLALFRYECRLPRAIA